MRRSQANNVFMRHLSHVVVSRTKNSRFEIQCQVSRSKVLEFIQLFEYPPASFNMHPIPSYPTPWSIISDVEEGAAVLSPWTIHYKKKELL
jgi:hypothetical protein